jgi:hypothetical protein
MSLSDFYEPIRKLSTEKGWRRQPPGEGPKEGREFGAYIALSHSELSEVLEAYRDKVWSETCYITASGLPRDIHNKACGGKAHDHDKPVGVGPELADCFIRLIDMADLWGIDLDYEVARVLAYGWTRPYRHGGRQL